MNPVHRADEGRPRRGLDGGMEKKTTPIPPRHRAYPLRPPEAKPAPEARTTTAIADRTGSWTRSVPSGRRFPRA
jgi:hypothetical protein